MPRYEYRNLKPLPDAEAAFLRWIERLDSQFANRDPEHRSLVVRNELHELYLGRPWEDPDPARHTPATLTQMHSFDPRNATLEPEYYGDVERPAQVKVKYLDLEGSLQEIEADGLLATCLQHEIDHLNGVLFIDHLSKLKRDRVLKKFTKAAKRAAE